SSAPPASAQRPSGSSTSPPPALRCSPITSPPSPPDRHPSRGGLTHRGPRTPKGSSHDEQQHRHPRPLRPPPRRLDRPHPLPRLPPCRLHRRHPRAGHWRDHGRRPPRQPRRHRHGLNPVPLRDPPFPAKHSYRSLVG